MKLKKCRKFLILLLYLYGAMFLHVSQKVRIAIPLLDNDFRGPSAETTSSTAFAATSLTVNKIFKRKFKPFLWCSSFQWGYHNWRGTVKTRLSRFRCHIEKSSILWTNQNFGPVNLWKCKQNLYDATVGSKSSHRTRGNAMQSTLCSCSLRAAHTVHDVQNARHRLVHRQHATDTLRRLWTKFRAFLVFFYLNYGNSRTKLRTKLWLSNYNFWTRTIVLVRTSSNILNWN